MDLNSIGNYLGAIKPGSVKDEGGAKKTGGLGMEDFLQLFSAQLKYQDMSSPMDNSEMMNQLTQVSSVTAMETMTEQMDSIVRMTTLTYASSMIGKEITISQDNVLDVPVKGIVTGAGVYNNEPCVYVNGTAYSLSKIMVVGNTND
ncbi:flagellar hook assembly protein FlgD [Parasporobacterium paucivorans]|uniref:Flagellar basal-body rod modification protein FlgD n=1 Tax=Parasporobacterium paucivorans DSM 15970 TaxID=1122934 RepID=A0A1M6I842_9FIRM|nr:flagellar hook capping FlgD N-terminal domain-containing protein [Parasporobacterium paucivorans]SHJ30640.1 flagellar basal-body rod modification protein FlgD [Parasporobacterium paucivorans DSM 15970]